MQNSSHFHTVLNLLQIQFWNWLWNETTLMFWLLETNLVSHQYIATINFFSWDLTQPCKNLGETKSGINLCLNKFLLHINHTLYLWRKIMAWDRIQGGCPANIWKMSNDTCIRLQDHLDMEGGTILLPESLSGLRSTLSKFLRIFLHFGLF